MIIDLDEIEYSKHIDLKEKLKSLNSDKDIEASIDIEVNEVNVILKGNVKASVNVECDRCLKVFPIEIDENFEEVLLRDQLFEEEKGEIEIKSNNFAGDLKGSSQLDISDFIYQTVILSIPNKNLCDINCIGSEEFQALRNEEKIDPRLQVFKDLSEENKKKKQ